jgi:hypothetical protein
MLRKIDCVMIRVADVTFPPRTTQRSLVCVQSGVEKGRLASFFQRPMLKFCFTARRLFLHQLKSTT